jgi:hypothetical protein
LIDTRHTRCLFHIGDLFEHFVDFTFAALTTRPEMIESRAHFLTYWMLFGVDRRFLGVFTLAYGYCCQSSLRVHHSSEIAWKNGRRKFKNTFLELLS